MEKHYKLRIDSHADEVLDIVKGMTKYCFSYEGEETDNPHMHFHLVTDLTREALRSRVVKLSMYRTGNGFYSLREMKSEEDGFLKYDAYIAKCHRITYRGYTEDEINLINKFNVECKEQMRQKKKDPVCSPKLMNNILALIKLTERQNCLLKVSMLELEYLKSIVLKQS